MLTQLANKLGFAEVDIYTIGKPWVPLVGITDCPSLRTPETDLFKKSFNLFCHLSKISLQSELCLLADWFSLTQAIEVRKRKKSNNVFCISSIWKWACFIKWKNWWWSDFFFLMKAQDGTVIWISRNGTYWCICIYE